MERLAGIRKIATEAKNFGSKVLHEATGDLLSPFTYSLRFRERSSILYGYVAEVVFITTGPVCLTLAIGEPVAGIAYGLANYVGLGIIWNHPGAEERIANSIFGSRRNPHNGSRSQSPC